MLFLNQTFVIFEKIMLLVKDLFDALEVVLRTLFDSALWWNIGYEEQVL